MAELAISRKSAKYTELESRYLLQPIAVELLGPLNGSTVATVTLWLRLACLFVSHISATVAHWLRLACLCVSHISATVAL